MKPRDRSRNDYNKAVTCPHCASWPASPVCDHTVNVAAEPSGARQVGESIANA